MATTTIVSTIALTYTSLQYGFWFYTSVYKPYFAATTSSPIQLILPIGDLFGKPTRKSKVIDNTNLIESVKMEIISEIRNEHFSIGKRKKKLTKILKRRHSI